MFTMRALGVSVSAAVLSIMFTCSEAWLSSHLPLGRTSLHNEVVRPVNSGAHQWVSTRRPRISHEEPDVYIVHMMARGGLFRDKGESKRQARISQVLATELSQILRLGHKSKTSRISEDLRRRISVVDVDISPDLGSAKVYVSAFGEVYEKREAYAWCVKNTKAIRHKLASNLRHMKRVPQLYFKETDVSAAVDLMALITKVTDEDKANAVARGEYVDASSNEDESFTFDFEDEDA